MTGEEEHDTLTYTPDERGLPRRSRLNPAGLKPVTPDQFHTFMISHAFKFFVAISILLMVCVLIYLLFTKDKDATFPATNKIVFYMNAIGFVVAMALTLIAGITAAVPKKA